MYGRIPREKSTKRPIQSVGDICIQLSLIDMLLSQKFML